MITSSALVAAGLISLATGAVSGFVLAQVYERPDWLRRRGVVSMRPIRQVHLDWIIMGVMMVVLGVALPDLPPVITSLVLFGAVVNPLLFIPGIFDDTSWEWRWMPPLTYVSYTALSGGLVAAAAWHVVG